MLFFSIILGKLSSTSTKVLSYQRTLTGAIPPFTENTESYSVDVVMAIDKTTSAGEIWLKYVENKSGFVLGYVAYNPNKGNL